MPKGIRSPCGGLIGVAGGASVGNFVLIRHRGRDEREGVSADENARNRDLDLGHVACDAFATRGAVFVVRVLCECRLARSVPRARTVAIQAYLVHRLSKLCVVIRAMDIVAVKACDATAVHHALHEVIALHAVLVRRAICKMSERSLAEIVLFKLPIILEVESDMEADRPVVIFSFDGTGERASLRVALDAGVVGADVIHSRRIHYVAPRGLLDVRTARTMTLFTAHVPLRHLLGLNVVINRMTAVASRPGRPLHIVGRIERGPPIGSVCDKV